MTRKRWTSVAAPAVVVAGWLAMTTVFAAPPASAAWPPDGLPLCTATGKQSDVRMLADGEGGAIAAWTDTRNGSSDIYAQRIGIDGNVVAGWPSDGLPVRAAPGEQQVGSLVPDGFGGIIVTWWDEGSSSVLAQRIRPDGTIHPGWPVDGVLVLVTYFESGYSKYYSWLHTVTADGAGGAYFGIKRMYSLCLPDHGGCEYYDLLPVVTHLTAEGTRGWGAEFNIFWPPANYIDGLQCTQDGAGGVICAVYWHSRMHVARFGATGARLWARELQLTTGAWSVALVPDGLGGVYIVRQFNGDHWAQRLTSTGAEAVGWPVDGIPVCAETGYQANAVVASGEPGQLFVCWRGNLGATYRSDDADIFAQSLGPDGAPLPGWPSSGAPVCAAPRLQDAPQLAYDGLGGAWTAWLDHRDADAPNPSLFATRLSPSGTPAPGWPVDGRSICATVSYSSYALVRSDPGGAIVAWQDVRTGVLGQDDIYAQRIVQDGPTAILVDLVMADVTPRHVDLAGSIAGGTAARAALHRRMEGGDEVPLAELLPNGEGRVAYRDLDVVAGGLYAYRLSVADHERVVFSREVLVRVPSPPRLALTTPYLGSGDALTASLSLTGSGPALIMLVDLTGRRQAQLDLGHLGPGDHTVTIPRSRALPSGVYLLQLTEGSDSIVRKACLIR